MGARLWALLAYRWRAGCTAAWNLRSDLSEKPGARGAFARSRDRGSRWPEALTCWSRPDCRLRSASLKCARNIAASGALREQFQHSYLSLRSAGGALDRSRSPAEETGNLLRFVILVLRRRHRLMPDRLGDTHFARGQRAAKIEVIDHPVGSSDKVGDLLGLIWWQVKHLGSGVGEAATRLPSASRPRLRSSELFPQRRGLDTRVPQAYGLALVIRSKSTSPSQI
jgi:hypothetical protein